MEHGTRQGQLSHSNHKKLMETITLDRIASAILRELPDIPNSTLIEVLEILDPLDPFLDTLSDAELLELLKGQ